MMEAGSALDPSEFASRLASHGRGNGTGRVSSAGSVKSRRTDSESPDEPEDDEEEALSTLEDQFPLETNFVEQQEEEFGSVTSGGFSFHSIVFCYYFLCLLIFILLIFMFVKFKLLLELLIITLIIVNVGNLIYFYQYPILWIYYYFNYFIIFSNLRFNFGTP